MAGCDFCAIVAADDPEIVLLRGHGVAAFLDLRPVFAGHLLIVPTAHVPTLAELPEATMVPLLSAVQIGMDALARAVEAEGTFVAVNNRISQSVPHLHVHVVPRRKGDGLRGFFWPRHPYRDADDLTAHRRRLREALADAAAQRALEQERA